MTYPTAIPILKNLLELAAQLLVAENPDLLLPPDVILLRPSPQLARARRILALTRDIYEALSAYGDEHHLGEPRSREEDLPF